MHRYCQVRRRANQPTPVLGPIECIPERMRNICLITERPMHILAITNEMQPYASILFVIGVAVAMATVILILTHIIGPKRKGERKDESYESGMPPIADARRRFNVRFYIVALLFLLFDVEVVILWPWALVFHDAAVAENTGMATGGMLGAGYLLLGAGFFFALLLVGYVYEWRKGVFEWDQ